MDSSKSNEFLTEKQLLEDFLKKLDAELNSALEDFEKVNLEKLNMVKELISENSPYALVLGNNFTTDFFKFKDEFDNFVSTFNESKRFKLETTLESFLDKIQLLRKDLYS